MSRGYRVAWALLFALACYVIPLRVVELHSAATHRQSAATTEP